MAKDEGIHVQTYNYDELTHQTILESIKLIEYFRMNLIYWYLVSGKGLEFDRIKEYVIGDDPRRMDWKIFARTGKLEIRKFKEERQYDIILVVDVSNSMLLGTTDKTKNEYASVVAGALAFAAVEANDNVAVVIVSDQKLIATDPSGSFTEVLQIISQKENYGGKKDWEKMVTTLLGSYSDDSIIFVISDFIDTNPEEFVPELATNFTKVYGVMIRDPVDNELPQNVGRMYFKDIHGQKNYLTDLDRVRKEYKRLVKKDINKIKDIFHDYDQLFFQITTNEEFSSGFIRALGEEEVEIS